MRGNTEERTWLQNMKHDVKERQKTQLSNQPTISSALSTLVTGEKRN